jgi:type II secretory pathway pseudopilin PulG
LWLLVRTTWPVQWAKRDPAASNLFLMPLGLPRYVGLNGMSRLSLERCVNRCVGPPQGGDTRGFGLVEVIVAMFLLALVVVGMLPALMSGIEHSAEQTSVASATRYMNSLVEEAREVHSCPSISAIVSPPPAAPKKVDGRGLEYSVSGTVTGCAPGQTARVVLRVSSEGRVLASTTALIYIR